MSAKKFWAGFVGGKLDLISVDVGWGGFGTGNFTAMPAIFVTRKEAREKYQDVRSVVISDARATVSASNR